MTLSIDTQLLNAAVRDANQFKNRPRWAIFCKVIDNFGDAGVCWRLAQQLAGQYGFAVDLFIDQLSIIERFGRYVDYATYGTSVLRVLPWPTNSDSVNEWVLTAPTLNPPSLSPTHLPADYEVIIAAFAVTLPTRWLSLMVDRPAHSWFNLEYLSAEPWTAQCHMLTSIKPITGACETFFFPGFQSGTGGLLREPWITTKGADSPVTQHNDTFSNLTISIFCYENAPIQQLIDQLEGRHITIKLTASGWVFNPVTSANSTLRIEQLPFLSQDDYDQLLAQCDLNFVRGEDSLVRAIWSAKPFIWQIYKQDENAHFVKLQAFLATWCEPASADLKALVSGAHGWWNLTDQADQNSSDESTLSLSTVSLINEMIIQLPAWTTHAAKLCDALSQAQDLCSALVDASGIIEGSA